MKRSIEIDRPAEEIFEYIEDGNKSDKYLNGSFKVEPVRRAPSQDGHYRLGSLVVGEGSFFGKDMIHLVYRVVTLKPGRIVSLKTEEGKFYSEVNWQLQPLNDQKTRVSLEVNLEPRRGWLSRMVDMMQDYIEPKISRYIGQSLVQLKRAVEVEYCC